MMPEHDTLPEVVPCAEDPMAERAATHESESAAKMRRVIVRLPGAHRERLREVIDRYFKETLERPSRADIVRRLVEAALNGLVATSPIAEQLPPLPRRPRPKRRPVPGKGGETLRKRIVRALTAQKRVVFTPARVAKLLGVGSRDTVRSTLLALAQMGKIKKVGPGRYRAYRDDAP